MLSDRGHDRILADLLNKSLQYFSGSHFGKLRSAIRDHGLYSLGPFDRTGKLIDQILLIIEKNQTILKRSLLNIANSFKVDNLI